jgi:hypothetical protein
MKALICEKWQLEFGSELVPENNVGMNQRSYLHFVAARPELVAAKCLATEWLLTGLIDEGATLVEYLAGVGIQSVIAREILRPKRQVVFERDLDCVEHLVAAGFDAREGNANKTMFTDSDYNVKFADFPTSSVVSVQNKWKGFWNLFKSNPQLVVWTDTACSYPITIHGGRYAKEFGLDSLESWEDYVVNYSALLLKRVGYSVKKAAFRGKNAVYFAAVPEKCEVEIKRFALGDCGNGFILRS